MRNKILTFLLCLVPFLSFADQTEIVEKPDFTISYTDTPTYVTTFQECCLDNSSQLAVVLSDGSRWIIKTKVPQETLAKISQNWEIGDDIRINNFENDFVLKNLYSPAFFEAKLDRKHTHSAIYTIEKMDKNGFALVMNDGSEWVFGWVGSISSQYWEVGQSIVINKSLFGSESYYLLINRHNGNSCWVSLISWK